MELLSRYTGDSIKDLIPQREPIIMVDDFTPLTDNEADSALTISGNNFFCYNNKLTEPGLIEHIAQSASAFAGYYAIKAGKEPSIGLIGEVKKCSIHQLPEVGTTIYTHINIILETLGVSMLKAETKTVDGQMVCDCTMKISVK